MNSASAFVVNETLLDAFRKITKPRRAEKAWSLLKLSGPDLLESFNASGYVYYFLLLQFQKQDIPFVDLDETSEAIEDLGTQVLVSPAQCQIWTDHIAKIVQQPDQLRQEWEVFHGEPWPDGGKVLKNALTILSSACTACIRAKQTLFLTIG